MWIILLIFVSYLTALVYIIARGRGMTDRAVAAATQARYETDSYIRQVTATGGEASPAEHIAQAKQLLDAGTITQAEYTQLKTGAPYMSHTRRATPSHDRSVRRVLTGEQLKLGASDPKAVDGVVFPEYHALRLTVGGFPSSLGLAGHTASREPVPPRLPRHR